MSRHSADLDENAPFRLCIPTNMDFGAARRMALPRCEKVGQQACSAQQEEGDQGDGAPGRRGLRRTARRFERRYGKHRNARKPLFGALSPLAIALHSSVAHGSLDELIGALTV